MVKTPWWKKSIVYQIYPRSFQDSNGDGIGDLQGIISRLDHIRDLGANVIWLCPVYKSPNDDNGYDISDYREIMAEFGTMADFDLLLETAHAKGLKIVMDLVVNHTSDEHEWFAESASSTDNPYRDYYIWRQGRAGGPPNNWGSSFQGSAWEYDARTDMYFLHLYSKRQPDLNWENEAVRNNVYDVMRYWLDKGIDGFRMDVINCISKDQNFPDGPMKNKLYGDYAPYSIDGPRVHEFLQEMNREVLSNYDIMTVGEMPKVTVNHARLYTASERNELNMVFQFEHVHLDYGKLGKWNTNRCDVASLKEVLVRWQTGLEEKGWNSLYWNNHDQPRTVSRFGNDSNALYWEKSAKMLAACLYLMKGTPFIYQGEEIGMTNVAFASISDYRDIDTLNAWTEYVEKLDVAPAAMLQSIHMKSRDNARTPMQWDDSINAGFSDGEPWLALNPNFREINAARQVRDPDSIFAFYQAVIALRKKYDVLIEGKFTVLDLEANETFCYTRELAGEKMLVQCNFTDREVPVPPRAIDHAGQLILDNYADQGAADKLRSYETRVYYSNLG